MTPAAFAVIANAMVKARKENIQMLDRMAAVQTAFLVNVQCGTEQNPCPVNPDQCMAFDWAGTEENTIEEPTMDDTLESIRNKMKNWVAATGGQNG